MRASNVRFSLGLERFSGFYLWAAFIVVFGVWKPDLFLTQATVHLVASSQAISAIIAIALVVPLAAGLYDLSLGAVANLSAIIATTMQSNHHQSMGLAIAVAIAVSVVIGAVNGFFVVVARVSSFIVTLAMATVVGAVLTIISGAGQPNPPTSTTWTQLTQTTVFGFQIVVLYLLVIGLIVWWLMEHTPAGRYLYAIGDNADVARLSGIRVGKWTWFALIVSSTLSGLAGVFYASLSGPSLTFGAALLLPAFAAAFLGSTQFTPGKINVWGAVLAVYVLATGVAGLQLVTSVQWLNDMFDGAALLLAVSFAIWRQRRAVDRAPQRRPVRLSWRLSRSANRPRQSASSS
jgi:ribose transport system permease protein